MHLFSNVINFFSSPPPPSPPQRKAEFPPLGDIPKSQRDRLVKQAKHNKEICPGDGTCFEPFFDGWMTSQAYEPQEFLDIFRCKHKCKQRACINKESEGCSRALNQLHYEKYNGRCRTCHEEFLWSEEKKKMDKVDKELQDAKYKERMDTIEYIINALKDDEKS